MNGSLTVSVSPHIRTSRSTRTIMLDVIIALLPSLAVSCFVLGLRALMLTAISAAVCVAAEFLWDKLVTKTVTVGDLSAVVTGILVAFNVPASMPVWMLIVGDIAAIIVAKMLFGGLGCNFMNPALVGRIVMFFSFAGNMTDYVSTINTGIGEKLGIDMITSATPLAYEGLTSGDFVTLLLGFHGGVIGEVSAAALIIGGIYLLIRGVITPTIPLSFIGGVVAFTWLFGGELPLLAPFMGGVMLGAIFMATDYVTSPKTCPGQLIFGVGCAFITVAIRLFANTAEGVSFAILLMNILVPYIDIWTRKKPVGGAK